MCSVSEGNKLNEHMALIVCIASAIGVYWIIEQPGSSVFFKTQQWIQVIKATKAVRLFTWLEQFGHDLKENLHLPTQQQTKEQLEQMRKRERQCEEHVGEVRSSRAGPWVQRCCGVS